MERTRGRIRRKVNFETWLAHKVKDVPQNYCQLVAALIFCSLSKAILIKLFHYGKQGAVRHHRVQCFDFLLFVPGNPGRFIKNRFNLVSEVETG